MKQPNRHVIVLIVNSPWTCNVPISFGSRDNQSSGLTRNYLQGFRTFNPFRRPR